MDPVVAIDWPVTLTVGAGIIVAAAAVATLAGQYGRRRIDRTRNRYRTQDAIEGWVDSGNRWHPGVVHLAFGWEDDDGTVHPGWNTTVPDHARRIRALESQDDPG